MSFKTGFFQNDVNFFYVGSTDSIDKINRSNYKYADNLYQILYIIKGSAKIISGNINEQFKNDTVIISSPHHTPMRYKFDNNEQFEYIFIDVHPSVFKDIESDNDFFLAFNTNIDEQRIFNLKEHNCAALKATLNSIIHAIRKHYNRIHMLSRLYALFSEIYTVFSEKNFHPKMQTDSISLKIMNYITDNYQKKHITYDELSEKFFVSVPTVNNVLYKWTGRPLNVFINDTRLYDAKQLMSNGNLSLVAIAEMCGFGNYSTFYRVYKKKFGRSPKQDMDRLKQQKHWPRV